MRRNIPVLFGLAILAVVLNHANWHSLSQFAAGDPAGVPYLVFDQIAKFAIAAFLFAAGFFAAYATSQAQLGSQWQFIRGRVINLAGPWVLWSVLYTLASGLVGRPVTVTDFIYNLFVQYYFVPLLIAYYALTVWLRRWAAADVRAMLLGAVGVQAAAMALFYLRVYWSGFPAALITWVDIGPLQYARFAVFFPLGLTAGMFPAQMKAVLAPLRRILPWLSGLFLAAAVSETFVAYRLGGSVWPLGGDQTKLSSVLFALAVILWFVTFDQVRLPYARWLSRVGAYTYGIYLSHYLVLGLLVRLIDGRAPWLAMGGWLMVPVLMALTVGGSLLLMHTTARSPARMVYPFLFG